VLAMLTACMHSTQYASGAPHAMWGIVSKWAALYLLNIYQNKGNTFRLVQPAERCIHYLLIAAAFVGIMMLSSRRIYGHQFALI
jgi:hypothetical protein